MAAEAEIKMPEYGENLVMRSRKEEEKFHGE